MSTPITTREDLTRIQWFAMSAYKNEKKAEEMLKGKDGLEYFIPKHYAVRSIHGSMNQSCTSHPESRLRACFPKTDHGFQKKI